MRILAIRGCNLASLAGEFEIDLASGALGGAGVFAIVGPTGAGKSTLLDAMCVALFDRTPRLTNHSRVVVGRGADDPTALGAQDVRTLLRRGASSGWAEVDFESGDSRRYRARWAVRRARNATDGRFQNQQITLAALDRSGLVAEQLGGTKTETLEAIHQRLGLTFDQFRRSALLAQGEFAAFLRADGKDRSELLERMTGTEIYSQLSIAAHVKAALAEQQLRERQGAALAIAVLSPEARAQAEADLALAKDAQQATRARLAIAEAASRWLAEAKSRRRALVEAETARSAAEQAVEAAQVLRAELALRRRAEAMRPTWDEAARLDRQLAVAQGELAAASDAVGRAEAAQREVGARRGRLVELHTPIREARIAAGLRIDERTSAMNAASRRQRADASTMNAASRRQRADASAINVASRHQPGDAITIDVASRHQRGDATTIDVASRHQPGDASTFDVASRRQRGDAITIDVASRRQPGDAITIDVASSRQRGDAIDHGSSRGKGDEVTAEQVGLRTRDAIAGHDIGARSALDAFDAQLEARAVDATTRDAAWLAARSTLADGIATWPELDASLEQHAALAAEIAAADRGLADQARRRDLIARQRTIAAVEHQQALARLAEAQREADAFSKRRGLTLDAARRAEDEARKRTADFERLLALTGEARGAANARTELERQLAELASAAVADTETRRTAEAERETAATLRTERTRVLEELRKAAGYAHARTELVEGEPCALCGATEHPWAGRGSFDALIVDAQDRLAESAARFERALATLATIDARDAHRAVERQRLTSCLATADTTAKAARASWRDQLATLGELLLVDDPGTDGAKQLADERIVAARAKLEAARTARHQAEAVAKAGADAQALVQTRHNDVEQHARALGDLDAALAGIEAATARMRGERAGKVAREVELLASIDATLARWLPAGDEGRSDEAGVKRGNDGGSDDRARDGGSDDRARDGGGDERGRDGGSDERGRDGGGDDAGVKCGRDGGSDDAGVKRGHDSGSDEHARDALSVAERRAVEQARSVIAPALARRSYPSVALSSSRSKTKARRGQAAPSAAAPSSGVVEVATDAGKSERVLAPDALAILDRCRRTLAELVEGWIAHAEVVVELDAALAASLVQIDDLARECERAVTEHSARRDAALARRDAVQGELAVAAERLDAARITAGFERAELQRLLADDPARLDALGEQLDALDRAADRARTLVAERRRLVDAHAEKRPDVDGHGSRRHGDADLDTGTLHPEGGRAARNRRPAGEDLAVPGRGHDPDDVDADPLADEARRVPDLVAAVSTADHHAAALAASLAADADAQRRRAEAMAELAAAERAAEIDRVLGQLIGSHDGKLFRSFAQSLTLDGLLAVANSHLEELAPRYQLERVPKHDLELQVIDRDLGNEIRSVQTLSGGESFLVSLALALGLSSMSAHDVRVRTLLIDEGFGTLDPATLDSALAVLDALQATGRQVGVISHVPALVERVGAHVRVSPKGGGRSEVVVAQA